MGIGPPDRSDPRPDAIEVAKNRQLFAALYDDLRRLADRELRRNQGALVSPTTLLHEAYIGMSDRDAHFPDRERFLGYAARVMRGLIIDLRRDASMADIARYVDGLDISFANRLFMKFTFRCMLLPRAWRTDAFARMLVQIPFRRTEIIPGAIGMEVWLDA